MLDHSREAVAMVEGKSRKDLDPERMMTLALCRLLEVVGEAAGRVPKEEQDKLADIKWHSIVGMRNRIIHGYDNINLDTVWSVIVNDLPPLIISLEKILKDK